MHARIDWFAMGLQQTRDVAWSSRGWTGHFRSRCGFHRRRGLGRIKREGLGRAAFKTDRGIAARAISNGRRRNPIDTRPGLVPDRLTTATRTSFTVWTVGRTSACARSRRSHSSAWRSCLPRAVPGDRAKDAGQQLRRDPRRDRIA